MVRDSRRHDGGVVVREVRVRRPAEVAPAVAEGVVVAAAVVVVVAEIAAADVRRAGAVAAGRDPDRARDGSSAGRRVRDAVHAVSVARVASRRALPCRFSAQTPAVSSA